MILEFFLPISDITYNISIMYINQGVTICKATTAYPVLPFPKFPTKVPPAHNY